MKDQNLNKIDKAALVFLSFFGTGYAPKAPGTFGSLATIPLIYLLHLCEIHFWILVLLIVCLTVVASLVAERIQSKMDIHDPGWIVIDEVIGMLVTWTFIYPSFNLMSIGALFLFFRFFDIIKIYPANVLDKKMKNGAGTIIDDVVSGLYAGVVLYTLNYFNLIN